MAKTDIYQTVTDQIIAELEAGAAPWVQPWTSNGFEALPHNAVSKREYSGTNVLLLWIVAGSRGYQCPSFLTFKQAKQAGGTVRKGERGCRVVYCSTFNKTVENADGSTEQERIPFLKAYTVFNIDQCDGLPASYYPEPVAPRPTLLANDAFQKLIAATGATIRHKGSKAFYVPSSDFIQSPHPLDYTDAASYKATILHELGHWTGHKSRLDRTAGMQGRFRSKAYAAEELVAELTAAFLCAHLGIKGELRHAGYIDTWLSLLKSDKRAIFTAASAAQKAADFIRAFSESARNDGSVISDRTSTSDFQVAA